LDLRTKRPGSIAPASFVFGVKRTAEDRGTSCFEHARAHHAPIVRLLDQSFAADRYSGILFNVKPNGDWLSTRYNDTEHNITLWTFHEGIRKMVKRGPGREPWHLARDQWHDLKMTVAGTDCKTYIDGQLALEYTLPEPVSGKIGLWSKTDSTSYFGDYVVESV
jgi:hypothetical protein